MSEVKRILLINGSRDGEYVDVSPNRNFIDLDNERYKIVRLGSGAVKSRMEVGFIQTRETPDVMTALLKGYRKS